MTIQRLNCHFSKKIIDKGENSGRIPRVVALDEGDRLDMDESRQVDAAERMNSLEGVGKTASSPPLKRARLGKRLDDEQEKTGKDETELMSLEDALVMPRVTQLINREFYFGQMSARSSDIISSTT